MLYQLPHAAGSILGICMALVCALPSTIAQTQADTSDSFVASVVFEDKPILLGDVVFARVVFANQGTKSIYVQAPVVGHTYKLIATATEIEGEHDGREITVSESAGVDLGVDRQEIKPGSTLTEVCLVRVVGHVNPQGYPSQDAFRFYTGSVSFDADVKFSEWPVGKQPTIDKWDRVTVRRLRRGMTIAVRVSGPAVDRYDDFRAIHGGREFDGWKRGLLWTDQLEWNPNRWNGLRDRLHPKSNLIRLLTFVEKYRKLLRSNLTDEEKLDAALGLLDDRRPMEREWLRARLRNCLAIDLPEAYYPRFEKNRAAR